MTFRVHVRQLPIDLEVEAGQTILDAALSAGYDYPCGCQSGNCGACKSVLLSGEVELAAYSEFALTDAEKAGGLVLACRAMPWSEVSIAWLEPDEVAAHAQRKLACRALSIEAMTHDIKRVRLQIVAGGPFSFSAGQFAAVTFGNLPPRDFSMANQSDEPYVEFHIRAMAGGATSQYVQHVLKVGDSVRVEGPHGISYLREKHAGPIVALAGGSGLAPIKSIVERALALGLQQPISLYFGVRDERDLYLETDFRALEAMHRNLRFIPVLSESSGPTLRRTGFLADVLAQDFSSLDGAKIYLAGPPIMVETCIVAAAKLGGRKEDCHADAFYTEDDKAKLAAQ
jgi:CDP-4-dehydro-6-deoxyglucose reductase/ferredoxin-NAD(P)+ reductase (naphthalene dioxygenase ferredoxin-specific)